MLITYKIPSTIMVMQVAAISAVNRAASRCTFTSTSYSLRNNAVLPTKRGRNTINKIIKLNLSFLEEELLKGLPPFFNSTFVSVKKLLIFSHLQKYFF